MAISGSLGKKLKTSGNQIGIVSILRLTGEKQQNSAPTATKFPC